MVVISSFGPTNSPLPNYQPSSPTVDLQKVPASGSGLMLSVFAHGYCDYDPEFKKPWRAQEYLLTLTSDNPPISSDMLVEIHFVIQDPAP